MYSHKMQQEPPYLLACRCVGGSQCVCPAGEVPCPNPTWTVPPGGWCPPTLKVTGHQMTVPREGCGGTMCQDPNLNLPLQLPLEEVFLQQLRHN